ncbi:MAG TPA: hypothetical protein VF209_00195 [Patescibacteria group bacterium]
MPHSFPIESHTSAFFREFARQEKKDEWKTVFQRLVDDGLIIIDTTTPLDTTSELHQVKLALTEKGARYFLQDKNTQAQRLGVLEMELRNKLIPYVSFGEATPEEVKSTIETMIYFLLKLAQEKINLPPELNDLLENDLVAPLTSKIKKLLEGQP